MKKSGKNTTVKKTAGAGKGAVPKKRAAPPVKQKPKKSGGQKRPPVAKPNADQVARKALESKVSHYRSALGRALYDKRKVEEKVNETQKKALKACEAAALAMAAAIAALVESSPESSAAPAEPKKEKPAKAEKPKEEPKKEEPAKPAAPAEKSIMDKVRDACKEYAGINGREALREVLNKYTDKTVADIPAEKLPEFLKDLGG